MALLDWLDERTGIRSATRLMLEEDVPGGARLRYVFGSVLVFLFMQQVVLGILLAFYYSPSATDAWASTAYLNDQVTSGGSCAGCTTTARRRWWWSWCCTSCRWWSPGRTASRARSTGGRAC